MATLEITQTGHPSLRSTARVVSEHEIAAPSTQRLVDDMVETMRAASGVGLAGPQVDMNLRLFVAEAHPTERRPNIAELELLVVFNPLITVLDSTWETDWEGCLSIDHGAMMGQVKRFQRIRIEGLDRYSQPLIRELASFHARIVQHETDHLDGILFFDRIYERLAPHEQAVLTTRENFERFFSNSSDKAELVIAEDGSGT